MVNNMSFFQNTFPETAFGELRVGSLTPQFQGSFEYSVDNSELNSLIEIGGGTVTQADAMCVCNTSTTTGSIASLISKRHAKYRPGLGGLLRFTALFSAPAAGTESFAGIMDEVGSSEAYKNGLAIGYDGADFGFHRWYNDIKQTINISDWDDPLDGTGPSGMTIDLTRLNVWSINYQYLGAGEISLSVENPSSGNLEAVHRIRYTNSNTQPSSFNPNYNFIMCANNKATSSDVTIKSSSYAYFVEGLTKYSEMHQPKFSSGEVSKSAVTTEVAILTIRNKSTYASKKNFIDLHLELVTGDIEANSANNLGSIRVIRNATLGGAPSYTDINTNNSIVEYDTSGTTVTGGKEVLTLPFAGKNDREVFVTSGLDLILAPGETFTLSGSSANSATIKGALLWKELF